MSGSGIWRSNISAGEGPLPQRDLFPDEEWTAKLAVAPGTVYGNRWEQMAKNAAALRVAERSDYTPPFLLGPPSNPRCFLAIRAGGVSLGRVVVELRADCAPLAAENFRSLCEFRVYKGAIFHRIFPDFIVQGGDYHRRCGVVCPPDAPEECFDLSLVPFQPGGRSIYSDAPDGTFRDEFHPALRHARGALCMSNPGRPDANGSQFYVVTAPPDAPLAHLDGRYVVFGQVVEGMEVIEAVGAAGRKDGTTLQRVVVEDCGVLPPVEAGRAAGGVAAAAAAGRRVGGGGALRVLAAPRRAGSAAAAVRAPRRAVPLRAAARGVAAAAMQLRCVRL